jgi:hypothetical protein
VIDTRRDTTKSVARSLLPARAPPHPCELVAANTFLTQKDVPNVLRQIPGKPRHGSLLNSIGSLLNSIGSILNSIGSILNVNVNVNGFGCGLEGNWAQIGCKWIRLDSRRPT